MQTCLVKCTPQMFESTLYNPVFATTFSRTNWQKFSSHYQKQCEKKKQERGGCVIQELGAEKGYFYLPNAMAWKKHGQKSSSTGSFQCLGQVFGNSAVGLCCSFHRAPTARNRICPWPALNTINLIYQALPEMGYFFFPADLIVI